MAHVTHHQAMAGRRGTSGPPPLPHRHRGRRRTRLHHQPAQRTARRRHGRPRRDHRQPVHPRRRLRRPAARLRACCGPDSRPARTSPATGCPRRAPSRSTGRSPTTSASASVARRGTATAHAEFNYTVHVDATGLDADRVYYYRFRAGELDQPHRPHPHRPRRRRPAEQRSASPRVSCQAYHDGYFTALQPPGRTRTSTPSSTSATTSTSTPSARSAAPATTPTAPCPPTSTGRPSPWRTTGCATPSTSPTRTSRPRTPPSPGSSPGTTTRPRTTTRATSTRTTARPRSSCSAGPPPTARTGRTMPLRMPQRPDGPDMRLYRRFHYGRLAQFDILDTRQYRSDQAYGDGWQYPGPESEDPSRTLTGATQERWLLDGFRRSTATWNVLPQQVTFSRRKNTTAARSKLSMDAWDGYPASRERVLAGVEQAGIENFVVLDRRRPRPLRLRHQEGLRRPVRPAPWASSSSAPPITSGKDGADKPANWSTYHGGQPAHEVLQRPPRLCDRHAGRRAGAAPTTGRSPRSPPRARRSPRRRRSSARPETPGLGRSDRCTARGAATGAAGSAVAGSFAG